MLLSPDPFVGSLGSSAVVLQWAGCICMEIMLNPHPTPTPSAELSHWLLPAHLIAHLILSEALLQ